MARPKRIGNMTKRFSVTIHPVSGHLTVSDALNQVLDLVSILGLSEAINAKERRVVWRLAEAHTNSPPFTVVAEPHPAQPELSISQEADQAVTSFVSELRSLLDGRSSELMAVDARAPIERILDRSINGIERTDIQIDDDEPISVQRHSASVAKTAIEKYKPDWKRTEMGSVEGEIYGLSGSKEKPVLNIVERLSGKRLRCVLSNELSETIGPEHKWNEVWEGLHVLVSGSLHYNSDGDLDHADIHRMKEIERTDVPLSKLRGVDVLGGKTVSKHLNLIWGESDG